MPLHFRYRPSQVKFAPKITVKVKRDVIDSKGRFNSFDFKSSVFKGTEFGILHMINSDPMLAQVRTNEGQCTIIVTW